MNGLATGVDSEITTARFEKLIFRIPMTEIRIGDLDDPNVVAFLQEHLDEMYAVSQPESCHVMNLDGLRGEDITFWTAHVDDVLAGCAALKQLNSIHVEIKSMRTSASFRGKGIGKQLLQHILAEANARGYRRLSLETGSTEFFAPARKLYERYGFTYCDPFDRYVQDPDSVFMTLEFLED